MRGRYPVNLNPRDGYHRVGKVFGQNKLAEDLYVLGVTYRFCNDSEKRWFEPRLNSGQLESTTLFVGSPLYFYQIIGIP